MHPHIDPDKIMEFTLRHVPFDGWGAEALKRGAMDADVNPHEAIEVLGTDPLDLIQCYSRMVDRQMVAKLENIDLAAMKMRDRISTIVMTRLSIMTPYREAVQKAAVILSLPINVPVATRLMYETVDEMWRLAGDRSTDFSYYTKRASLSAVYSSTLLYWFRDMSADCTSTRDFLNRRLDNVMMIPKVKAQLKGAVDLVTAPLKWFINRGKDSSHPQ